jgi:hypothetical protein
MINNGSNNNENNRVERVILSFHAQRLKNVAGAFKGTSDPYAVVTLLAADPTQQAKILGQTEVLKNELSPHWVKTFELDYEFARSTRVNVGVYDEVKKARNDKPMGSTVFEIGEVFGSAGNIKAKKLKGGGVLFCRVHKLKATYAGTFHFQLQGHNLKNVETMLGKTNPFFEVSKRTRAGGGGTTWQIAYRSEALKKEQNPKWKAVSIALNDICDGDQEQPVMITVKDWDKKGKHKKLHSFETNVNGIIKANRHGGTGSMGETDTAPAFELKTKGKKAGSITVLTATIEGDSSTHPPLQQSSSNFSVEILAPPFLAPPVAPPPSRPKFVDYLSGGLELQMSVAVDFTGSNGDPRKPGTLHHIERSSGQLNNYEKALTAVGSIIARYDSDQKFPMLGFGAKFGGIIKHCFQLGPGPEVDGIKGMLDAYRNTFQTGLTMSGPTVFAEVIQLAAAQARSKQQYASRIGQQAYHILLILTDGAVSDVQRTKRAIAAASDAPLSIVIVGIGNADFSAMQFLDDFQEEDGGRDICQFVEFQRHLSNKMHLTQATLEEIPDQVVEYFHGNGLAPLAALSGSKVSVVASEYNEEDEIDLNLTFGEGGEIHLASGGVVDDTQFGDYNTFVGISSMTHSLSGITPMAPPPPTAPHVAAAPSMYQQQPQHQPYGQPSPPESYASSQYQQQQQQPSFYGGHQQPPHGSQQHMYAGQQSQHHQQQRPSAYSGSQQPPYGSQQHLYAGAQQPQVVSATVMASPVFLVQLPPNVTAGQHLQVQNPRTQQPMIITVPPGVPSGGTFPVSY